MNVYQFVNGGSGTALLSIAQESKDNTVYFGGIAITHIVSDDGGVCAVSIDGTNVFARAYVCVKDLLIALWDKICDVWHRIVLTLTGKGKGYHINDDGDIVVEASGTSGSTSSVNGSAVDAAAAKSRANRAA